MTTLAPSSRKAKKTKRPVVRTLRILQRPSDWESGIVRLTIDGEKRDYHFDVLKIDPKCGTCCVEWTRGFNDEAYHVLVKHDGSCSCDCPGGSYKGKCKHCDATPVLLKHL